jgi:hypothetical protein
VTRGTRPEKPSSSRGFAREARGAWGFWDFGDRKPKIVNCNFFLSFQAGNNYQIYLFFKYFFYFLFLFCFFACARIAVGREGEGGGEGREVRPHRRPCPRGRWGASAQTHHVRADARMRPRRRECFTPM